MAHLPPYRISNLADSIPAPVDRIFSWWVAGDKHIWLDIARDWYSDDMDMAAAMCDSLFEKNQTARTWSGKMKNYGLPDSSIFFEYVDWRNYGINRDRALALWIDQPQVQFSTEDAPCYTAVDGLGEILGKRALLLLDTKRELVLQKMDNIYCTPLGFVHEMISNCFIIN